MDGNACILRSFEDRLLQQVFMACGWKKNIHIINMTARALSRLYCQWQFLYESAAPEFLRAIGRSGGDCMRSSPITGLVTICITLHNWWKKGVRLILFGSWFLQGPLTLQILYNLIPDQQEPFTLFVYHSLHTNTRCLRFFMFMKMDEGVACVIGQQKLEHRVIENRLISITTIWGE